MSDRTDYSILFPWMKDVRRAEVRRAQQADEAERAPICEGLKQLANAILDDTERRAVAFEESLNLPPSERERRLRERNASRKAIEREHREYERRREERAQQEAEAEAALAAEHEAVQAERRAALTEEVKNALRQRYLAAGGSPQEFDRDFPDIIKQYRIKAALDGSTDPKAEFAAYARGRYSGGRLLESRLPAVPEMTDLPGGARPVSVVGEAVDLP